MSAKPRIGLDVRIFSQKMNGVARYTIELLKFLRSQEGIDLYLFTDTPLRPEYSDFINGLPLLELKNKKLKKYWKNWILPWQLFKNDINLYHATWDKGTPLIAHCPCLMTIHDLFVLSDFQKNLRKRIKFFLVRFFDAHAAKGVLTVSEATKSDIIKKLGISSKKILVTHLGCDQKRIQKSLEGTSFVTENLWGLEEKKYFFCLAGRVCDVRKNVPLVIESYAHFIEVHPARSAVKLVIAGDYDRQSEFFKKMENRIQEKHLERQIVFTGAIQDAALFTLLKHSSAMLFSSLYEGFGLPIVEAYALNVPVITGNISSMKELGEGGAAILVNVKDPRELAAALEQVCADPAAIKRMVDIAAKKMELYSWERMCRSIWEVYQKQLGAALPSGGIFSGPR